jgi:hypothetical protein
MEKAPKWNAGKQRGKPVRQRCIVPIVFSFWRYFFELPLAFFSKKYFGFLWLQAWIRIVLLYLKS